jgi:hypothetical protein
MIGDKAGGGPHCLPLVVLSGCTRMAEKADELAKLGWKRRERGPTLCWCSCAHTDPGHALDKSPSTLILADTVCYSSARSSEAGAYFPNVRENSVP